MILHIPHSSDNLLNRDIPLQDRLKLTDWFTDELFGANSFGDTLIFGVSRFVVDVERFPDDKEPLFKDGFGICYTKTLDGKDIEVQEKDELLALYNEHHKKLNSLTGFHLAYFPKVVIVDCHSFNEDLVQTKPDFCIGYNKHEPFMDTMKKHIEANGYTCEFNSPYAGAIVPTLFENNPDVYSVMIEVNKKLYMEIVDDKPVKKDNFREVQEFITSLLSIVDKFELEE